MSATVQQPGATNARVELARYRISAGERLVCGQRVDGVVRLVDVPVSERGRRYLIERGLTSMAELEAIVADYVRQAEVGDAIPAEPVCLDLAAGGPAGIGPPAGRATTKSRRTS